MSEIMLRVSETDWSQAITSVERPVEFLLRQDIAVYIKVRRDSEVVYRYYHLPYKGDEGVSMPRAGFLEEAAFLRLDDVALAEIVVSRSCLVSSFSQGGLSIPVPYEVDGESRGGYVTKKRLRIENAVLTKVDFDRALILDKNSRDRALEMVAPMDMPFPEQFVMRFEFNENDLYMSSFDLEVLKQAARNDYELVKYPFSHAGDMPAIYGMFQAAYALNHNHLISESEVLDYLRGRCAGDVYGGKRGTFAAKLVPVELDRAKGRKDGPRKFKVLDLKNWTEDPERFIFSYVGEGLTMVLAVADWWVERLEGEPNESRVVLANKLYEQNFDQTETGYLVRLMTGVNLSMEERSVFERWAREKDRRAQFLTCQANAN